MHELPGELFRVQREHEARMRHLLAGRQPGRVPVFQYRALELPKVGPYDREQWLVGRLAELHENPDPYCDPMTWRVPALALCRYGLHFTSAVLGCDIEDRQGEVWCRPRREEQRRLEQFLPPNLAESPVFQEMLDLLRFVAGATRNRLPIELPFLAPPLLAAVDLFGQDFLVALADAPEQAARVLRELAAAVLDMRARLLDAAPGADLRGHHTCACPVPADFTFVYACTTQLVSGTTYREHIAALDAAMLRQRAHGGCLHLCGRHTQHLDTWRRAPEVKAVQVNDAAALDFEAYWRGLRKDQFVVLWLTDDMPLDRVLAISGGRRLALRADLGEPIPVG